MIVYYKCSCTSYDKLKVKELRGKGYEVRIAKGENRKKANEYNLKLPFIVVDEELKIGKPL